MGDDHQGPCTSNGGSCHTSCHLDCPAQLLQPPGHLQHALGLVEGLAGWADIYHHHKAPIAVQHLLEQVRDLWHNQHHGHSDSASERSIAACETATTSQLALVAIGTERVPLKQRKQLRHGGLAAQALSSTTSSASKWQTCMQMACKHACRWHQTCCAKLATHLALPVRDDLLVPWVLLVVTQHLQAARQRH